MDQKNPQPSKQDQELTEKLYRKYDKYMAKFILREGYVPLPIIANDITALVARIVFIPATEEIKNKQKELLNENYTSKIEKVGSVVELLKP